MDSISDVSLVGVSGGVLIILLMQAVKVFGLPDRWVQQVTLLCGFVVSGTYGWLQDGPYDKAFWVGIVVRALVMGLTAAGLYSHITQPNKLKADAVVTIPETSAPAEVTVSGGGGSSGGAEA